MADENKKVTHLHDIKPVEVSIVDKGANDKQYLVIKRADDTEYQFELKKNDNGGLETVKGTVEEIAKGIHAQMVVESADALKSLADRVVTAAVSGDMTTVDDELRGLWDITDSLRGEAHVASKVNKGADATQKNDKGDTKTPERTVDPVLKSAAADLLGVASNTDAEGVYEKLATVSKSLSEYGSKDRDETIHSAPIVSKRLDLIAKSAGDVSHLLMNGATTLVEQDDPQDFALALAGAIDMHLAKAKKPAQKQDDETDPKDGKAKGGGKKFTASRMAKLLSGVQSITEVLTEVGAKSLDDLLPVAKNDPSDEAAIVVKRLKTIGVTGEVKGDATELASLKTRLEAIEAAGVRKSIAGDDSEVEKKTTVFDKWF